MPWKPLFAAAPVTSVNTCATTPVVPSSSGALIVTAIAPRSPTASGYNARTAARAMLRRDDRLALIHVKAARRTLQRGTEEAQHESRSLRCAPRGFPQAA